MENKINLNLGVLNGLDGELVKNTVKFCIIEKIIKEVPEENQEQFRKLLEDEEPSAIKGVKLLRRIGFPEGSEGTIRKHRTQTCACYL